MVQRFALVVAALGGFALLHWQVHGAAGVHLVRLVDSETSVPGGTGTFFLDNEVPAPCDLGVVFSGADQNPLVTGIYVAKPGVIDVIADPSTPVPQGVGNFERVESPACVGSRVVFRGRDSVTGKRGLFLWVDGQLSAVATSDTPSPHATHTLSSFGVPAVASERIVFVGRDSIAAEDGVLLATESGFEVVADEDTPVPAHPADRFTAFAPPDLSSRLVAFRGFFGLSSGGVYSWDGALRRVADLTTPIPDQAGHTFLGFGPPAVADHRVIFGAATPAGVGLYVAEQGRLVTRVPPGSVGPDGTPIVGLTNPRLDGPRLAFLDGNEVAPRILYLSRGVGLERVLGEGDLLDGREVVTITHELSQGILAMRVQFEDSSQALYAADLREPLEIPALDTVGVAALGLLLATIGLWWIRRGGEVAAARRSNPHPDA